MHFKCITFEVHEMRAIETLRRSCRFERVGHIFPKFDADGWTILEEEEGDGFEIHIGRIFLIVGIKKRER